MSINSFPSLMKLRRSESILETVSAEMEGLILMSGGAKSGVTTTITALAHEFMKLNKKVLHVRLGDSEILPGVDAVSSELLDSKLIRYLSSLEDNAYDLVILDDKESSDTMFHLAAKLAHRRTLVAIGMEAASNDKAVEKFGGAFSYDEPLQRQIYKAIILSVHHFMFNIPSEDSSTEAQRKPALEVSRKMFAEVNPEKHYPEPNKNRRLLINPYPYPKL